MNRIFTTLLISFFIALALNTKAATFYFMEIQNNTVQNISVNIYPNPISSNASIQINLNIDSDVLVEFFDMTGKKVKEFKTNQLTPGIQKIGFSSDGLKDGVYLCKIITKEGVEAKRVIVKR
jgi:uncharacterized protein YodC (DUF2158 family)